MDYSHLGKVEALVSELQKIADANSMLPEDQQIDFGFMLALTTSMDPEEDGANRATMLAFGGQVKPVVSGMTEIMLSGNDQGTELREVLETTLREVKTREIIKSLGSNGLNDLDNILDRLHPCRQKNSGKGRVIGFGDKSVN